MSFKQMSKIFFRLMVYIVKPRKGRFLFAVCCILFSAFVVSLNIRFTQRVIDDFVTPLLLAHSVDLAALTRAVVRQSVIIFAGFLGNLSYTLTMAVIAQDVQRDLRDEMFAHMQTLPISYFDRNSFGDVMSYYTNDIDTLRQMIGQAIPQIITNIALLSGGAIAMVFTNAPLTLLSVVIMTINFFVLRQITEYSSNFFKAQQSAMGKLNGFVEEIISGQKTVKVFSHEQTATQDFGVLNDELRDAAWRANRNANMLQPITGNLGHMQYVLTSLVGGLMMLSGIGGVTIGVIGSFLQFGRLLSINWSQMSMQLNFVVMACAGAERLFDHLDECGEQDEGTVTLSCAQRTGDAALHESTQRTGLWAWKDREQLIPLEGNITLEAVDFSYVADNQVLHRISMYAKPGQKVALIGSTGAGKTTITNLLNRFYDISAGTITYDGIDIARIRKADLRRSLGIVLQDTALFSGTVYDNIRYGNLDATDEQIEEAARLVNADVFIRSLPQGYHTLLSGNSEDLSQGQRQLLSLARAAVSDPPVMVLDEATSSIDTRTERLVQTGMDALMEGRTVFVIAHRLSTIVNSDIIMVMEHGRIIERGDHRELMQKQGRYYQLYTGVFDLV